MSLEKRKKDITLMYTQVKEPRMTHDLLSKYLNLIFEIRYVKYPGNVKISNKTT